MPHSILLLRTHFYSNLGILEFFSSRTFLLILNKTSVGLLSTHFSRFPAQWPQSYFSPFNNIHILTFAMAPSRLSRLPRWISHWLGYRPEAPKPLPTWQIAAWSFIAAFGGLSVVQGVYKYSDYFKARLVPGIVASYVSQIQPGASLVHHTTPPRQSSKTNTINRAPRQSSSSAPSKVPSPSRAP